MKASSHHQLFHTLGWRLTLLNGVVLRVPDDPRSLLMKGDLAALRRLFLILLHHAITYTPTGGQIWLEAKPVTRTTIEITVRDTDRGIAPADLPHLFTRFYRADKARTRSAPEANEKEPGGMGLGLAIAQSIVERHRGTFTVHRAGERKGSTFMVTLQQASSSLVPPEPLQ